MVSYGFSAMELHRVSSWCVADNVGSARVLDKAGLRLEGRLRENEYYKADGGTRCSMACLWTRGRQTASRPNRKGFATGNGSWNGGSI